VPTLRQAYTWPAQELQVISGKVALQPLHAATAFRDLRAEDGFGRYSLSMSHVGQTDSAVFWLETGELWAVDTAYLAENTDLIPFVELRLEDCFRRYVAALKLLPIEGPLRWICGMAGIQGRRLEIPNPPHGVRIVPTPTCVSDQIVADEVFEPDMPGEFPLNAFFEKLFDRCGEPRPAYLDEMKRGRQR
jgi:hypothetical protein